MALQHAAGLPEEEAVAWIARHGLLVLQESTHQQSILQQSTPDGPPGLPEGVRSSLAELARRNLAANLLRIHRFQAVADALAPLPLCPLKGIYLLDTVFAADPQHRVMADLDLLVRPEDEAEAVKRLATLGYRETAASRRAARHWHERVLDDGRVPVELHGRLGVKHGRHSRWEELAPQPPRVHGRPVHGRPVHRLDDATTLVHLVTHFVKHGPFVRLGWAEDVLRVVDDGGDDGAEAFRVARRLGAARSFVAGVRALSTVAGEGFLPAVPRRPPGRLGALVALHERWIWPQLAAAPAADVSRGGTSNSGISNSAAAVLACGAASSPWRRNLSAVLLADRPSDALAFLAAKGGEMASRRPFRTRPVPAADPPP